MALVVGWTDTFAQSGAMEWQDQGFSRRPFRLDAVFQFVDLFIHVFVLVDQIELVLR